MLRRDSINSCAGSSWKKTRFYCKVFYTLHYIGEKPHLTFHIEVLSANNFCLTGLILNLSFNLPIYLDNNLWNLKYCSLSMFRMSPPPPPPPQELRLFHSNFRLSYYKYEFSDAHSFILYFTKIMIFFFYMLL